MVGIGRKSEPDELTRSFERRTSLCEQTQILDRIGDNEGKLLRLAATGGVHGAAVGRSKRAGQPAR